MAPEIDRGGAWVCSNGPMGAMDGRSEGLDDVFAPGIDLVAYDLSGMSDVDFDGVLGAVDAAGIRHHVSEEEELFVAETDEERIETIFDEMTDPEELPLEEDGGDGLETQEVLSEVFAAADRLQRDGRNADAVLDLVKAADRLDGLGPPFGFGQEQWDQLRGGVDQLRTMLQGHETDLPTVEEAAGRLRRTLQSIV